MKKEKMVWVPASSLPQVTGAKGGKAGVGASKRRDPEICRRAQRASVAKRKANRAAAVRAARAEGRL